MRSGGENAERIKASLQAFAPLPKAKTGAELVAFFRSSPLVEIEFSAPRDESTGRAVELA